MLLGIAAELSIPPSSPSVYRDLALWAKIKRNYDVLAICPHEDIDLYVPWFRRYGLFDYVDDILPREQAGYLHVEIEGGKDARLTEFNFHTVLGLL